MRDGSDSRRRRGRISLVARFANAKLASMSTIWLKAKLCIERNDRFGHGREVFGRRSMAGVLKDGNSVQANSLKRPSTNR